jgi:excisionase family DNA binding protein
MTTNKSASNSRFDTRKGIAEWLGRTPRYVDKLAEEKIIPFIQLPGRDRLFDRERVAEALARFERKAAGQ